MLQRHYHPLINELRHRVTSRAEFQLLARQDPSTLTDIERAARFYYLQRLAFGGHVTKRTFGVDVAGAARFNATRIGDTLEAIHNRLAGVVIECLDWSEFIDRYDRAGTLFYLDPPYFRSEKSYGADLFSRDDFARIADQLRRLKGRFMVSLNDCPEVREIFAGFHLEAVRTTYTISAGANAQSAGELIITLAR